MSLILEALNKADRSREGTISPADLSTSHFQVLQRPAVPLWSIWLGLFFLAIITVALVALVWQLLSPPTAVHSEVSSPVVMATALPQQAPAQAESNGYNDNLTAQAFKPLRRPNLQVDKPSVAPEIAEIYGMANGDMASLYGHQADSEMQVNAVTYEMINRDVTAPQEVVTHNPVAENLPVDESALASLAANTVSAEKVKNNNALPSAEEVQRMWRETKTQVEPVVPVSASPYAQTPYLYQLPENFQRRIPSLLYQNHIYSVKGSAVILNGKTYRKNDLIAPDLVVREITEDDLILDYLKRPFKLAALSSWVQMD